MRDVTVEGELVRLPFNPSEIAENLRFERYSSTRAQSNGSMLTKAYYLARPLLGVSVRKHLQRMRLRGWEEITFPRWPVDATVETLFENLFRLLLRAHSVDRIPFVWFWPDRYESCVMMTHDVETRQGLEYCASLMDMDERYGIKSSFQLVPEGRYQISRSIVESVRSRGFEANIHDLNHDGHLFSNRELFLERSLRINEYAKEYRAEGFRSAVLYRNQDWLDALEFEYDMSIPTSGHLDAQQGGCCSVFPFFIGSTLELPVTTTQDYSLFHILDDYSTEIWKHQMTAISKQHGLVSFIVHPDYLGEREGHDAYLSLLRHLEAVRSAGRTWFALPGEVNSWWRDRSEMSIVAQRGGGWKIEGPGSERAKIAYATLCGSQVVYQA